MNSLWGGYPQDESPPRAPDRYNEEMTPESPRTSHRLRAAAQAEQVNLDRHRQRLLTERKRLQAELDQIEHALSEVEDRLALIGRIVPPGDSVGDGGSESDGRSTERIDRAVGSAETLRGTAIRETAIRLLVRSPEARGPIHYRRIFEMLTEAGYAVAGKNPLASFLTQLGRSPLMRKTTEAGVYELDFGAADRLRRELARLQSELRTVTSSSAPQDDLGAIRERRDSILSEMARVERALDEVSRVLDEPGDVPVVSVQSAA